MKVVRDGSAKKYTNKGSREKTIKLSTCLSVDAKIIRSRDLDIKASDKCYQNFEKFENCLFYASKHLIQARSATNRVFYWPHLLKISAFQLCMFELSIGKGCRIDLYM